MCILRRGAAYFSFPGGHARTVAFGRLAPHVQSWRHGHGIRWGFIAYKAACIGGYGNGSVDGYDDSGGFGGCRGGCGRAHGVVFPADMREQSLTGDWSRMSTCGGLRLLCGVAVGCSGGGNGIGEAARRRGGAPLRGWSGQNGA